MLLNAEAKKGAPLTREEVESIRDRAAAVALPRAEVARLIEVRGYEDIDPERAWEEWQVLRTTLVKGGSPPR